MALEISQECRGGLWVQSQLIPESLTWSFCRYWLAIGSTGAEPRTRHHQQLGSGSINPRFAQSGHQILPSRLLACFDCVVPLQGLRTPVWATGQAGGTGSLVRLRR
ncbi:hypothetical protein M0657_001308 [Pyricularia oryzae]|nr:hypothetical protein M9X92_004189 [Pyricularia oryzae]KAI7931354.1 hypothetical protein M0657_001308 [Pyricularia oryzae]QBZ63976.1 hypothetical protein PoMZ_05667 [Pyricularia oryzae]